MHLLEQLNVHNAQQAINVLLKMHHQQNAVLDIIHPQVKSIVLNVLQDIIVQQQHQLPLNAQAVTML